MSPDRAIAGVLGLSILVVLALGSWLLWRGHRAPAPPASASPTASPTASASATPTGALPEAVRGYRLAGTVVGDVTYAILEKPTGGNELVRPGQILRGIGQVIAIDEYRIVIEGHEQRFELPLASAPTATPTRVVATAASPSPAPASPARSASESSP